MQGEAGIDTQKQPCRVNSSEQQTPMQASGIHIKVDFLHLIHGKHQWVVRRFEALHASVRCVSARSKFISPALHPGYDEGSYCLEPKP